MIKVSIIVPIYNVEKYLSNCLDSLLEQDLHPSEYEIICINDGSKDNCKDILSKYVQNTFNIIIITQENQGVSVARNSGIDAAKGEYILFVDGDDRLYPNVLQKLYQHAKNNTLDLLYLHVDYFDENDNCTGSFIMDDQSGQIFDGFKHQRRGFIFGLYRSAILSNIRFEKEVIISEDALFNIIVHSVAKRCSYLSIPAYKYLIRNGSALKSDVPLLQKTFLGYLKFIDVLANYVEKNKLQYTKDQIQYFDRPLYKISEMALLSNIIPNLSISRYIALRKKIKEKNISIIEEQIKRTVPFYGTHWSIFISYYRMAQGKNFIYSLFHNWKKIAVKN